MSWLLQLDSLKRQRSQSSDRFAFSNSELHTPSDAWFGGLLDCLDDHFHVVCPVCVPPGRGDCFVCFCVLFCLLNVE